jgi:hypothetical protein
MTGMTDTETASYLAHHLKLSGRSDTLFNDDATRPNPPGLHRAAPRGQQPRRSSPRRRLTTNKAIVDESSARGAVAEVTTE